MRTGFLALGVAILAAFGSAEGAEQAAGAFWNAPDRGAKVAALIPGRRTPKYTPQTLFADWTKAQVERWAKEHPGDDPAATYAKLAATAPTDAELTAGFPVHISPFGRLHGAKYDQPGHHVAAKADAVMVSYCPLCGSQSMHLAFDPKDPYGHATTTCCRTDLYAREADWPAGSPLKPNTTVKFLHLDDAWVEVPCTLYKDRDGVKWDLFISTLFAHKRWIEQGGELVRQYCRKYEETADPLYVHKIAILLDRVADTYYGLPLASYHRTCLGKEGKPLTRAEWEALPRPAIFEVGALGPWSKRRPYDSPGWLNMVGEHIWVEPFARVRHHPAFKQVSQKLYGDPEALDRKVMSKLMRELSLMFQGVFSQKLLHNYQEAIYIDLWLLGVLLQDKVLTDFAGPCQELSMYNHSYQDGMNGEGAPNYMDMPGGYYYPVLNDPKGWLQYQPRFAEENPFFRAASTEMHRTATVRGLELEFGDQHQMAFAPNWTSDPARVRERERIGSRNWAGYGVGLLRVGGPGHRQEFSLDYTRASLHNAQDALSMECWVDGVPVMRKGGYSAHWHNARLQWDRPEYQALRAMGYPCEIQEADRGGQHWGWDWSHSPLCQNTLTVDEVATGAGWGDNRGYGECLTFKGGEGAGEPGSGFQVLDVRDHYSWSRVGKKVSEWRRTAIGVEGPDGRPYVLDITRIIGGQRHALYNNAWAERAEERLPKSTAQAADLTQLFFGGKLPEESSHYRNFANARKVERRGDPGPVWDVTWKTDYAAFASRDLSGRFRRPIPEDVGRVRLRFIGLGQGDGRTEVLTGKGPWIGWLRQPLPNNQRAEGNVAFMDARDFVVEYRTGGTEAKPLESRFVHVIEGYREGEQSAIRSVTPLQAANVKGGARQIVALRLAMAGGHTDTVIYQAEPGALKLPDGTETDACYALVRRDRDGQVLEADAVRGTYLRAGAFGAAMAGDLTGTIVDVVGDLTGTRTESALVLKPDKPWPAGANLRGKQLLVRVESPLRDACNEGYRVERVTALPGGLVRVDLQDAVPFAVSWHEVKVLPADRPNALRTWRPMVDHGNGPWYNGLKLWFPERGKSYTIKRVNEVGGGYGGDTVELVENVNLAAEGIREGDWYVIYAVRPGQRVAVAGDFCFRREPAAGWQQAAIRATGDVRVRLPAAGGPVHWRAADGEWRPQAAGPASFTGADLGEGGVVLVAGKPAWLNLEDSEAPTVTRITLDGQDVAPEKARDLGWVDAARRATVTFADAGNPLEIAGAQVLLDGRRLGSALLKQTTARDGRELTLEVDLAQALAGETQTRRHTLLATVADRSIARQEATATLSFLIKVPLDQDAIYLSDLKALKSFAHGGPNLDRDYVGDVAQVGEHVYPKCVMICPELSAEGAHGEVIYELPQGKGALTLHAEVGIEETAKTAGSAVFLVQTAASPGGPWETYYTSPTMRGGGEPAVVKVPLSAAKYLRLYTTDAGDGIGSDHALWGGARLKR